MKIIQTVFTLEPTKIFKQIQITNSEKGYYIQLQKSVNNANYVIFKNCIIGAFAYLANKKYFDDEIIEYYMSYEDCEDYLRYIISNPKQIDILVDSKNLDFRLQKIVFGFINTDNQ